MEKLKQIENLAEQIKTAKASRAAYDALINALEAEKALLEEELRREGEKETVKVKVETVSEEEAVEEICENSLTDEQIAQMEEIFNDDFIFSEEFDAEIEEMLADMPPDINDWPDFPEESSEGNKSEKTTDHQKKPSKSKSSMPEEMVRRLAEKHKRAQQQSENLRYISRRSHYGNRGIRT